jgi:hypothetical protein
LLGGPVGFSLQCQKFFGWSSLRRGVREFSPWLVTAAMQCSPFSLWLVIAAMRCSPFLSLSRARPWCGVGPGSCNAARSLSPLSLTLWGSTLRALYAATRIEARAAAMLCPAGCNAVQNPPLRYGLGRAGTGIMVYVFRSLLCSQIELGCSWLGLDGFLWYLSLLCVLLPGMSPPQRGACVHGPNL